MTMHVSARTRRGFTLASVSLILLCEGCSSGRNEALFGDPSGETPSNGGSTGTSGGSTGSTGATNGKDSGGAEAGGSIGAAGTTAVAGGGTVSAGGVSAAGGVSTAGGRTGGRAGAGSGGLTASGGRAGGGGFVTGAGGANDAGNSPGSGGSPPGDGGSPGDSGSGGGTSGQGMIRCGTTSCDKSAGEVCCIKDGAQRTVATCAQDGATCSRVFRCDSDSDCAAGEHCCMDYPDNMTTTPGSVCSAHDCSAPLSCTVPSDCPDGQMCCGSIGAVPMVGVKYTSVTCQSTCKGLSGTFCVDDTVCGSATTCQQSATLPPGYLVCR